MSMANLIYWIMLLHFNHSHSQQYYALALSERVKDIGVDVEELGS
jgi:4'-phosphopantetheinyl transferase